VNVYVLSGIDDELYRSMTTLPGMVLRAPVTPRQHEVVCAQVGQFALDRDRYSYDVPGEAVFRG
jgi:hypothetical protein